MNKTIFKKLLVISIFLSSISCSKNNQKDNFDFSDFKVPIKKSVIKKDSNKNIELKSKEVPLDLIELDKRDAIINSIKFGKKDPFLLNSEDNPDITEIKLKGVISVGDELYALINYLDEEGSININSIGGINTKLLPKGAKVKKISILQTKVIIVFQGKEYKLTVYEDSE